MEETIIEIKEFSKKGFGKSNDVEGDILSSIPGEKGTLNRISGKGRRALYILEELKERSEDRVDPKCKHFTSCGGCSMQHVSYERQLKEKQQKIEKLFVGTEVSPIVGMDDPWRYRGKMEFTFSQNKAGEKFLGLIKPKSSGFVENLTECQITDPWFAEVLIKVRAFWEASDLLAHNVFNDKGSLLTLTVRRSAFTKSRMLMLTVSGNSEYALTKKQIADFVAAVDDEECSIFVQLKCVRKGTPTSFYEMHVAGPAYLEEQLLGTTFHLSPKAFFQPNPIMAEKFFTSIIEQLELDGSEKVLDLFSGIGTISMLLSPHVDHVVAVEIGKEAVCDARENIERLGMENIEIYADDVSNFINTRGEHFIPDIVIVDPPRCGIGKVAIEFLEKLKPKKVVYLSCNAVTQAEDIEKLPSYRIESCKPFDQFPQTVHSENLIILSLV